MQLPFQTESTEVSVTSICTLQAMSMRTLLSKGLSKVIPTTRPSRDSYDSDEESSFSDRLEDLYKQSVSFHGSHQQFFIRVSLALSVAFWVTIFSLPLYFGRLHYKVFGFRGELHETYSAYGRDPVCESGMVGKMRNVGTFTEPKAVLQNLGPLFVDLLCGSCGCDDDDVVMTVVTMMRMVVDCLGGLMKATESESGAIPRWCPGLQT